MHSCECAELGFFTTEHTEEKRRATEYCKDLGNDGAPRRSLRGARSSPKTMQSSVALMQFSVCSVVKKPSLALPSMRLRVPPTELPHIL